MDKDVKLGNLGDLDISIVDGKAILKLSASADIPEAALSAKAEVVVTMDGAALLDKMFAAIEKASPPGAVAIEEGVKAIVKAALSKV